MNKRQKLVQQQFLNNEEAVIKRLNQVYNKSLNDINDKIKNLTFTIDKLQQEYDWMDPDDPKREKIKSQIQSKIYQKQYQEQLQSQVDGILKQMQTKSYLTVSDYLNGCYTDGFIGTIFDAHGQGVPIITPINQEAMVRAVQLESKISKGLYTRLGEDVDLLKKKITAEVTRAIATGESYAKTAKQLANQTRIGYNNAVRIARTEGHRIQTTATMDAMYAAKDKGANVVKQWDATLDGRTRHSHAVVDGEIRELNKSFSNGLDFPGDPDGQAAEVVNCRCALLQRAKWALDDDELKTLQDRAKYFGLDKAENFEDFKKKYLKATENSESLLTKSIKHDKIGLPDIQIGRSIGAKAQNYDVIDPSTGEFFHFVEGTRIHNSEVFAGMGVKKALKEEVVEGLNREFKINSTKWQHAKGIGTLDWHGEERNAEVHWFQEESVGKVKFKVKEWLE
jgi:hypothetical protein